jgi:hypothetical protein
MVECYWPGVTEDQLTAAMQHAQAAAIESRNAGADVAFVGSILMPGDETVFLIFQGTEDDIRATAQRSGIVFERVVEWHWRDGHPSTRIPDGRSGDDRESISWAAASDADLQREHE